MKWHFKDVIFYHKKCITQDSRKFEILVEQYLKKQYPLENWQITKSTRDGNKDVESICHFSGESMWAEVKYTIHTNQNLSSRKYDSTLVSSSFEPNLIKIFFITNTSMGTNLIGRIKSYYYLSTIEQIAFVDGYTLAYWIKKNPDIENNFFKSPLHFTPPSFPHLQLRNIRIFCKSDSYTIESILESQKVYPLYLADNYILEGEFVAFGFENINLELYCNDVLLYNNKVPLEIVTFKIDIQALMDKNIINHEYLLDIYYILDGEKYDCETYHLHFAVVDKIYKGQYSCYTDLDKGIRSAYKQIFNVWGPEKVGKSWIINNLKNDLLKEKNSSLRIIYTKFSGNSSDIADICRIIFTLIFDYYNISLSADSLEQYCKEINIKNAFFSHKNITLLINALIDENYSEVQNILSGSIFSQQNLLFEIINCFDYDRVYFVDNLHLLSEENRNIFNAILKTFDSLKRVTFVLTGREEIQQAKVVNINLNYLSDEEVLESINEIVSSPIKNLTGIFPKKHYLNYPGLLKCFLKDIDGIKDCNEIRKYYIASFQKKAFEYVKGNLNFDNILLLIICMVKEGVPLDFFVNIDEQKDIAKFLDSENIINKNGYIYPNIEYWNQNIPEEICKKFEAEITHTIFRLIDYDNRRKEIYQCALMLYYPKYYNIFFASILSCIKNYFSQNNYYYVIHMSNIVLNKSKLYCGTPKDLDYVKFYLAFSYMHCDAGKNALKYFSEIISNYDLTVKDDLYFWAKSEVIDAKYWNFKHFYSLPQYINVFRKEWKETLNFIPELNTRTYLTATNRMMVTSLAVDCLKHASIWFKKNLKLAAEFCSSEHIGYTYMDYAKGIYHIDLKTALNYLQIADTYFQTQSEKRRHLDCQCEIQYVKLLLGQGNINQLLLAQSKLFEHQYWVQYYKCYIKLAVYCIINNQYEEARKYLIEAEAPDMMQKDERVQYLCCILKAFLFKNVIDYNNISLKGTSYHKIINYAKQNAGAKEALLYKLGNTASAFYIDPRAW